MAKKLWRFISWLLIALIIASSAFVLYVQISFRKRYEVSLCNQYSMLPNLNLELYLNDYKYVAGDDSKGITQLGDYAVLDTYNKNFKAGDIVSATVNWPLTGENEAVVKRLVGLPNDKIKITPKHSEDGGVVYELYVNNSLLYSKPQYELIGVNTNSGQNVILNNTSTYYSYLKWIENGSNKNVKTDEDGQKCIVLGDDEYLILGDNWESSYDCMDEGCGPIKAENLGNIVVTTIKSYENYRWQMFKCAFRLFFDKNKG